MYGDGSSVLWAKTQLLTIDFASATKESADENALNEFSNLFVRQYHYIKLTEFILFVARFKLGRYGKFYGYFDTITIGEAFRKFLKERSDELDIAAASTCGTESPTTRRLTGKTQIKMKDIKLIATILSILTAYAAFYFVCYWIADYCLRTYL